MFEEKISDLILKISNLKKERNLLYKEAFELFVPEIWNDKSEFHIFLKSLNAERLNLFKKIASLELEDEKTKKNTTEELDRQGMRIRFTHPPSTQRSVQLGNTQEKRLSIESWEKFVKNIVKLEELRKIELKWEQNIDIENKDSFSFALRESFTELAEKDLDLLNRREIIFILKIVQNKGVYPKTGLDHQDSLIIQVQNFFEPSVYSELLLNISNTETSQRAIKISTFSVVIAVILGGISVVGQLYPEELKNILGICFSFAYTFFSSLSPISSGF